MFNVEYSGILAHSSLLRYMIDTMIRIPNVECYCDREKNRKSVLMDVY